VTGRTLRRACKIYALLVLALVLVGVLAAVTGAAGAAMFNMIGPILVALVMAGLPVLLVMAVIRAISMSTRRRATERGLRERFDRGSR
jgi:FtsH-binding integral membrane protein